MQIVAYCYREPLLLGESGVGGRESEFAASYPAPLAVERVYCDWGDRQQWQELLADAQVQPPEYVWVSSLADLGEDLAEVGDRLATLDALGVEVLAGEGSEAVAATAASPEFLALLSQVQAEQRRRALQRGHARKRLQALPPPGKAPYGYRRGQERYILDRSTAPVVKAFFERYLLYGSLRGAVRYLEQKFAKKISPTTGQRWLRHPVYRGDTQYATGEVIPDTHAAILSREEAAQIDRLLRRNRRLPPRAASAPRSLAGLVQCAQCQSLLTVGRVQGRDAGKTEYLYLRPQHCPQQPKCRALRYDAVLRAAIARICETLPPAVAAAQAADPAALQGALAAQVTAKQEILAQLPALEQQGILDADTAALRRYKLQAELAALRQRAAQLPPANLRAIAANVSLPQFWLDLSEAERRFYLREFVQQIAIARSPEGQWQVQVQFIF